MLAEDSWPSTDLAAAGEPKSSRVAIETCQRSISGGMPSIYRRLHLLSGQLLEPVCHLHQKGMLYPTNKFLGQDMATASFGAERSLRHKKLHEGMIEKSIRLILTPCSMMSKQ